MNKTAIPPEVDLLSVPTHDELVKRAGCWLRRVGCGVVFTELVAVTTHGEIPDAIGWRDSGRTSILVECKVTRADFLADRQKVFRADPTKGMGDWRFYLCPPGVINTEDLPAGWGLLYWTPRHVRPIHGMPEGNSLWGYHKMNGAKQSEIAMMISALRRLELRGVMPMIYDRIQSPVVTQGAESVPPVTIKRMEELLAEADQPQTPNSGMQSPADVSTQCAEIPIL